MVSSAGPFCFFPPVWKECPSFLVLLLPDSSGTSVSRPTASTLKATEFYSVSNSFSASLPPFSVAFPKSHQENQIALLLIFYNLGEEKREGLQGSHKKALLTFQRGPTWNLYLITCQLYDLWLAIVTLSVKLQVTSQVGLSEDPLHREPTALCRPPHSSQ